ncbi:hypothetical protein OnM2_099054 [Erysiphe neolycopersici]|uniref:Uncharacterized protein n=1 Tax=Erysiphe neolycopersici TaxID=212602 RepID=A0A420H9V4_9PEZI|nr:hypothetical protein OnM2_099054 [Erysiphe neolycopersici]
MSHQEEFSRDHDNHTKRRQALLPLSHTTRGDHENTNKNIDDMDIVDLREYTDWFMNHNSDVNLRFDSAETLNEAVNRQPETYSSNSSASITVAKKKKYRNAIVNPREEVEALTKERDNLRLSLDRLTIQDDWDSDVVYLNQGNQRIKKSSRFIINLTVQTYGQLTHTTVSEPAVITENSSNGSGSYKPPDRMEVFDGRNRDKHDDWVDKFLGQIRTHGNWFSNEDRKLTSLMGHLTCASYNLLKILCDERARAKLTHGRTLSGTLAELDSAFRAYDTRHDAKTKLETLRMDNSESFGDFFAKFQVQTNRLDYHDEDKIDGRFASKLISGRKDTYEELISQCFTLDLELKMYEAKKTTS